MSSELSLESRTEGWVVRSQGSGSRGLGFRILGSSLGFRDSCAASRGPLDTHTASLWSLPNFEDSKW